MGTIAAMSLPTPTPDRTPLHTRTLTFRGFARPDGLWDMEGELHDTKHYDHPNGPGTRLAGQAIHHLFVRVTLDAQLCIHDIATSMDTAPFGECGVADQHMRRFIGLTMGKGWRKTIERHLGGCRRCQGVCDSLKRTLRLCQAAPAPAVPGDLQKAIRSGIRKLLDEGR